MMKKFFMFLLVLLSVQNAYSNLDGDEFDFESGDYYKKSLDAFYFNDMEDSAIRALCKRFLAFASARDFHPLYKLSDGRVYYFQEKDCKDDNMGHVKVVTLRIADGLDKANLLDNSQDKYECMLNVAKTSVCTGQRSSIAKLLKRQKYNMDFLSSDVSCSKTDNRCVVNVPVDNGGFFVSCCNIPAEVCDGDAEGYVGVGFRGVSDKKLAIEDFDYDCTHKKN